MPEIVADNISIINSVELEETVRLDAEYYQPEYLQEDSQRIHFANIFIRDFCYVTDGQHGYHEVDERSPISHLTAKNAKGWFANIEGADRIAKWVDDKNKRSSLKENDLILSTRGTVGFCAFVTKDVLPANIDQDVARIAINTKSIMEPAFVLTYLNSKYGQDWLARNASGMVQQGISLDKVRKIPIPQLPQDFQGYIKKTILSGRKSLRDSQIFYSQAETLLLEELGIKDIDLSHDPSYEVDSADSISVNRIDAEYYQPKYERIIAAIKNSKYGWCKLSDRITNITDKYDPHREPERDFRYIELSNINPSNGLIDGYSELKGRDLPSRARMLINEGDVIISSVEGSIDKVALVDNIHDGCIASTGFFVFRAKENTLPEYVLPLCKSVLIQKQLEKLSSGTILTAVPKNLVESIIIPNMPKEVQVKIADLISQSHAARRKAKALLEEAKRKVEEMIEKGVGS